MLLELLLAFVPSFANATEGRQDSPTVLSVHDKDSGKPIFARVVLRNAVGEVVGSTGYKTLNGHFVAPDGWSVVIPRGAYTVHLDAGFEYFATDESWTADGAYRLQNVPLAAHLEFGATQDRNILFHDARIADLQRRIWSTEFAGKPDSLGGVFPPDYFRMLRDLSKTATIDVDLGE